MSWRWITIAAVLAAVVVGFGILSGHNRTSSVTGEMPVQPAYYLKDAVITETERSGAPTVRLIASRIEQQPADDSIVLQTVRVDYLKVPDKRWYLSAQRGFVPADSRLIQFKGNVELRPTDGPASTLLRADELTIDSERNVAYTTTSPVDIRFGAYSMTVKRFEADLTTEKVRLETVHGRSEAG